MQERPLLKVEYRQFYIFYQKGGLALYYLKEMIGEAAINRALRDIVQFPKWLHSLARLQAKGPRDRRGQPA